MNANISNQFKLEGLVAPIDVLTPDEVAYNFSRLNDFLEKVDHKLDARNRHKPHLYLKWVNDLARHPRVIEPVKQVLGENVLLWYSVIFVKLPRTIGKVPWHQDYSYWAMNNTDGLTAWIALSDVDNENGCIEYGVRSHLLPPMSHRIENDDSNLLARGQMSDAPQGVEIRQIHLKAGQMSLHDSRLMHSSGPNNSDRIRAGLAFRYIPTGTYPMTLRWMKRSATLVSGVDSFRKFEVDPIPAKDWDEACMRFHAKSVAKAALHTLFGDKARSSFQKTKDLVPILFSKKTLRYVGLG